MSVVSGGCVVSDVCGKLWFCCKWCLCRVSGDCVASSVDIYTFGKAHMLSIQLLRSFPTAAINKGGHFYNLSDKGEHAVVYNLKNSDTDIVIVLN